LLSRPVYADTNMAELATGNTTVVFGDFNRGYFARIAGGVRVEQTNADKWTTDLVSVRFIVRGGGVLVDTNALRKLVQA
jgi:HK97 family phage major capsid protein